MQLHRKTLHMLPNTNFRTYELEQENIESIPLGEMKIKTSQRSLAEMSYLLHECHSSVQ